MMASAQSNICLYRQEFVQQLTDARHRRGAAGNRDLEAADLATVDRLDARVPADVVDRRSDVIVACAAFEGDLELARQRRS